MKQVLKYFCFALCFILFQSCKESAPPENTPPNPSWEKMKLPDEVLVTSMKIFNDELYVTGRSGGAGPISGLYKTSDGIKWEIVSPAIKDSVPYGLESVAMRNNKLVILRGGCENKPIYEINGDGSIIPVSPNIWNDVSDIEIYNNDMYIGCSDMSQYYIIRIDENKNLYKFADSVSVSSDGCTKGYAIVPIYTPKLLNVNLKGEQMLLAGTCRMWTQFMVKLSPAGVECFPKTGLTSDDLYNGAYDFIVQNDTIFAATRSHVKYFVNGVWKLYGEEFPLFNGEEPLAVCIDKTGSRVFAGTTWRGVYECVNNKWIPVNEGLPHDKPTDIYPAIDFMRIYKGYLYIGFGDSKLMDQGMRGVWRYKL